MMHRGQDDRGFFPPVERAQIENLACSDPAESGLEQIRWSVRALADAGLAPGDIDGIVISTCTGYLCPGLTSYVIERLGLAIRERRALAPEIDPRGGVAGRARTRRDRVVG